MKTKTQLDNVIQTLKSLDPKDADAYGLCAGKFVHPGCEKKPVNGETGSALLGDDMQGYRLALADACEILAGVSGEVAKAARG